MLRHQDVWGAIDRLAAENGLSASALARRAGLDPTSFNKSKRVARNGKPRWPTTEKSRQNSRSDEQDHGSFRLLDERGLRGRRDAAHPGHRLCTGRSRRVLRRRRLSDRQRLGCRRLPECRRSQCLCAGDFWRQHEPIYRDGDVVIVSPRASIRRGDRVVVRTKAGEIMAKSLSRQTANRVELTSFNPAHSAIELGLDDIEWMARIIWASQ